MKTQASSQLTDCFALVLLPTFFGHLLVVPLQRRTIAVSSLLHFGHHQLIGGGTVGRPRAVLSWRQLVDDNLQSLNFGGPRGLDEVKWYIRIRSPICSPYPHLVERGFISPGRKCQIASTVNNKYILPIWQCRSKATATCTHRGVHPNGIIQTGSCVEMVVPNANHMADSLQKCPAYLLIGIPFLFNYRAMH